MDIGPYVLLLSDDAYMPLHTRTGLKCSIYKLPLTLITGSSMTYWQMATRNRPRERLHRSALLPLWAV